MGGHELAGYQFAVDLHPVGTGTAGLPPRLCGWCLVGSHHMCTGVGCWRCPRENHPRKPGTSSLGPTLAEHPPAGHAIDHKPAHTRGGRR